MENLSNAYLASLANSRNIWNEKVVEVNLEHNRKKLCIGSDVFMLSWITAGLSKVEHCISFEWREIRFDLKVTGDYRQKSTTIYADLKFLGQRYRWGVGKSSVGAGVIGCAPQIRAGNYALYFSFGQHHIQVLALEIPSELKDKEDIKNSCFKFFL